MFVLGAVGGRNGTVVNVVAACQIGGGQLNSRSSCCAVSVPFTQAFQSQIQSQEKQGSLQTRVTVCGCNFLVSALPPR